MSANQTIDFQFLAENSIDIICRTAPDTRLLYVSPSSSRILGFKPEEMMGRLATDFILAEDLPSVAKSIAECNAPGVDGVTSTIRFTRKHGPPVWMEVNARAVRDKESGNPTEHVIVMRDITDRKLMEEKLSGLALTDGLTGLRNRRAFDQALDSEWKRTLMEGSQVSLLLLDIDHFKKLNDQYGHQFGDDCLCAVSVAVTSTVRASDTVARYGGEEIAVILPGSDHTKAIAIAERMRTTIESLQLMHEQNGTGAPCLSASIGVATAYSRNGGTVRTAEGLILAADSALYKAKYGGRNQIATALIMAHRNENL